MRIKNKTLFVILFITIVLVGGSIALAGQSATSVATAILIDGKSAPDRIPDWIVWRELFARVRVMANIAPDQGRNYWIQHFSLTADEVEQLIGQARRLREDELQIDAEVKEITHGKNSNTPSSKSHLNQLQFNKKSLVLDIRDRLRLVIGMQSYLRLQSFIRLAIAPNIKVGGIVK